MMSKNLLASQFTVLLMATVAGYRDFMLTPLTLIQRSVVRYFVDCVEKVGGCPSLVRTDRGTENVVRAECNHYLAGEKAHRYGPSTGKQRIEVWWSYFRRSRLTW